GYLDLKWDDSPVAGASSESESGRSFGFTAQAGLEWYLLDNFALDIRARFDGYDIATTVVDGNRVTQLEDRSSASVLVGLVYRFGQRVSRQAVPAPVVLTTQCQPIFPQVPVDSEGCPLARFTFRLEYPAEEFSLASLLQRPDFNVVQFLKTYPDYRIVITGHTDDRGSAEYNQTLSEKRVAGVQQYLKENGVDPARIQAKGRGESAPLTSNDTDIGRQQNRRIELEFVRTSAEQGE
ncbi:MAG TPA: OmpA family protein, partial [Dongiaceae bacterium]|nr:OmpA family protein [Dongiaceae bacterium]